MDVFGKILTGAGATALLAIAGHYISGDKFISGLEESAQTELNAQGMDGISVTFGRDPLSRNAILDGEATDEVKQKAMGAALSIAGVSSARWKGADEALSADGSENGEIAALDPATNAKITQCQSGIDKAIEGKKLSFRSGSAWISLESDKIIDEVAAALKPCSGLAIAVSGHTDANGDAAVNKILSQERADRVRGGLVKRGIAENLVTATGYGSEKPLVDGRGGAADAQNRRIEFKVQAAGAAKTGQGE